MGDGEATLEECWDSQFRLVFGDYVFPELTSTVGNAQDCAASL